MDYIAFIAGLPEIAWDDRKLSLTVAEFREQLKIISVVGMNG